MSSCQLFFLLFTSQLGKWLFLRTVQRCRLLAFSVVSVTGQSAFWKVDRTLFLHSLQAVAISKSCAIRSFTHSSVGFMVIWAWLGYVDTTDTFCFPLTSNRPAFSLLQAASVIVSYRIWSLLPCFLWSWKSEWITLDIWHTHSVNILISKNAEKQTPPPSII